MGSVAKSVGPGVGIVFTFPGQGSYNRAALRELYTSYPQTAPYFVQADQISRRFLGCEFLPVVLANSAEEHDARLKACPDLDQIGIYLTEVLIARLLMEGGLKPDLLLGHSFGELAALAVSGVYTIETGLKVVCQRVLMLQCLGDVGKMAAASCDAERAGEMIRALGASSLQISVINHPRQTVISGTALDLDELAKVMNRQGISLTVLKSRYPFHSTFLEPAVQPFRAALKSHTFQSARIPVYLGTEQTLFSSDTDPAETLPAQFIRRLNFSSILRDLYNAGYRKFVECGAGNILSKLALQNLGDQPGVAAVPAADSEQGAAKGVASVLELFGLSDTGLRAGAQPLAAREVSALVHNLSQLADSASQLLQRMIVSDAAAHAVAAEASGGFPPDTSALGALSDAISLDRPASGDVKYPVEECAEIPIAIVAMGCVLPGSKNPEHYWKNIEQGISGIVNMAERDPAMASDFLVGGGKGEVKIAPDKTYTLLHGSVGRIEYDAHLLRAHCDESSFNQLTRGDKLLALALAQSCSQLKSGLGSYQDEKIQCVLGATGDGCGEYDDSLFLDSVHSALQDVDEPDSVRGLMARLVDKAWMRGDGERRPPGQCERHRRTVEMLLGRKIRTYVVDAACSSSLYSINLGMKALQDREADLVLAGGVFAPGPANNTLFAQFRGLTPKQSRPFDASADGVVFGDGAGVVILKRLPDALASGDKILAVIRGIGLSSDGRSPAINVPQAKGQSLAISKAYERWHLDPNTVQYVEAHATATPVGDAVEFAALKNGMARKRDSARVALGSVKALIGHTGWAAGVASVIKLCKAFEKKVIPRQYNFDSPNPEIDLDHTWFTIPQSSEPWPNNVDGYPRRAAINGFGFGGTNAHLILEAFEPDYHRNLCTRVSAKRPLARHLAVVAVAGLFPSPDKLDQPSPSSQSRFRREMLRLPAKKMLLPDVTEHMDPSQYLAALAAEQLFADQPEAWKRLKSETGIVLGLESKTERGVQANERIFLDRLRRLVFEAAEQAGITGPDVDRVLYKLTQNIHKRIRPSGPYTLPGLMPNVAAGRVAHMFDLHGPNIVVDMGGNSLFQSVMVARDLLQHDDCKVALAGGVNACGDQEAVLLLALTSLETAEKEGLPIVTTLEIGAESPAEVAAVPDAGENFRGATGAVEVMRAIDRVRTHGSACSVKENESKSAPSKTFLFAAPVSSKAASQETEQPAPSAYAYVQGTPITYYTPVLVPRPATASTVSLKGKNILFVTDQPDQWAALEQSGGLKAFKYSVACPKGSRLANSVALDLSTDGVARESCRALDELSFDAILAVKFLTHYPRTALLVNETGQELRLLDLMFAICRHSYEKIRDQHVSVSALCLGGCKDRELDPYTGLMTGFMKSLTREAPDTVCKVVSTDDENLYKGLRHIESELAQPASVTEVCYRAGERHVIELSPLPALARDHAPCLNSGSIVVATGGARGVTAVLVEELLERFQCTVIALGRTDPDAAPAEILQMDDAAFQSYEPQFYRQELAKKSAKIPELKQQYLSYQAVREANQIVRELKALPGRFEYVQTDITSQAAVDSAVHEVYRRFGKVDFVLHGAGIQASKVLPKKSIEEFRRIVATKLGSLSYLYRACRKYANGAPVHFHILTSVFSYMGNDGQPDYGAANEAMNRIAAAMSVAEPGCQWSSMNWLGWAGIGMTRGSEFAALASRRRLRGVTKEEGRKIFSALMDGFPAAPINVLLADGEIAFYQVSIAPASTKSLPAARPMVTASSSSRVVEKIISIEDAPYLLDHVVNGIPTLPGAYIILLAAEAALQLRPNLKVAAFENASFQKFVRVTRDKLKTLRIPAEIVSEDSDEALVRVRILSDFIHQSGVVLQKDILQTEIFVRMATAPPAPPSHPEMHGVEGQPLCDPYVMEDSPVRLNGIFRTMNNIKVGTERRRAEYKLAVQMSLPSLIPNLMVMDSLWRFGAIEMDPEHSMPVYVPESCRIMKVYFDISNFDLETLRSQLTFRGANPRREGDKLIIGPVEAVDRDGQTMLTVEGGVCRRFGEVRNAV